MKSMLLWCFMTFVSGVQAQTRNLIPDSCTFCLFQVSNGGFGWYDGSYGIDPDSDTLVLGNSYVKVNNSSSYGQPFGIRQVGNKLFGVVPDSLSEYLIMDFESAVSDTIHHLYSEGFFYDAVVLNKDSVQVNNGIFHHFVNLKGIGYYSSSGMFSEYDWDIVWNERSLCAVNSSGPRELGGVLFNVPTELYSLSAVYAFAAFCTTDPIYNNPSSVICQNCNPQTNSLDELILGELALYPNPVINELFIQSEISLIQSLSVYDVNGVKVVEETVNSNETRVNTSKLAKGIYFIKLETDQGLLQQIFFKI